MRAIAACVAALALATSLPASARAAEPTPGLGLPPELAGALAAARRSEAGLRAADADVAAARAAVDVDDAGLWPSLTLRGGYTRNQHEAKVVLPTQTVIITPYDQLEATVTLNVPLLDLGRRARIGTGAARVASAAARADERRQALDEAVATAWYQAVMAQAIVAAAEARLAAAEQRLTRAEVRQANGAANPLDRALGQAEVARARQLVADGALELARARREVQRLAGEAAGAPALASTDGDDGALDAWLARAEALPSVAAARQVAAIARREADASDAELVPRVDAFVSERVTNASGFGEATNLTAGVTASLTLELGTFRRADERRAAARAADERADAALRDARARIADLWDTIGHRRARIGTQAVELAARREALRVTEQRLADGAATVLDVATATHDAFAAEVELRRAEAELGLARLILRVAAGVDVLTAEAAP